MKGQRVILAAHRGDRKRYPENTMPAFIASQRLGADMIETDIHLTLDGELVIMHDRSPLRTCGVDGLIDKMTLSEVKALDAGALFAPEFAGVSVPTVREFLEWVKDTDLLVNWELKDYPRDVGDAHAFAAADRLVDLIYEYGMSERSMVNSFSARVLEHIKLRCGSALPVHGQGILRAPKSYDDPEMPLTELFDWCCLYPEEKGHSPVEYAEQFAYCLENCIIPCVCITDREDTYRVALAQGCKMFTSNDIVEADRILTKLGVRS